MALAATPAEQIRHLQELGTQGSVEELALQFDDIAAAADDMYLSRELDSAQLEAVKSLNEQLSDMSRSPRYDLWAEESLASSPEWLRIRRLAAVLLGLLSKGQT